MSSRSCASRLRRAPQQYNFAYIADLTALAALTARVEAPTGELMPHQQGSMPPPASTGQRQCGGILRDIHTGL